jgi:hypothetical protein
MAGVRSSDEEDEGAVFLREHYWNTATYKKEGEDKIEKDIKEKSGWEAFT